MGNSRRDVLLALAALAVVQRASKFPFGLAAARAQDVTAMSAMSATQRMVFDSVLYDNAKEYLAYAKVVQDNMRGNDAVAAFNNAINEVIAPGDLVNTFNDTLGRGIAIDLAFLPSAGQPIAPLPKLLLPTIPKLGLPETLARNIDGVVNQGAVAVQRIDMLIGNVQSIVPVVPKDVSEVYWRAGLTLLAAQDDLSGLLGTATAAFQSAGGKAKDMADSLKHITGAISAIAGSSSGPSFNYAAAANELEAAVSALGSAVKMNPDTVNKINKTVSVVGSVLTGAAAGAALGPIGAAVGAVAGLLGGLLGGGGGGDGTGKALAQLSSQISELEQHVLKGLQELGAAIASVSQQIERDFSALSAQIATFQSDLQTRLDQIRELIVADARTMVANLTFHLIEDTRAYDGQYRERRLTPGAVATATADPMTSLRLLFDNMKGSAGRPLSGYCGPAFVGTAYNGYIADLSNRITGREPVGSPLKTLDAWMRLTDNFDPPIIPPLLTQEVANLARRLRHSRYALSEVSEGTKPVDPLNGAGIVQGLQQQCFDLLRGIGGSPEDAFVSKSPLLPSGASAPDPLAPQDIWDVLVDIQTAVSQVSDSDRAAALISESVSFLRPRLGAQYLMTGQNLLPALFYIRRQALQELADSAAIVFCNPFMAAIQVFRRVIATKLSAASMVPARPSHSTMSVTSNAQAQQLIANYRRASQPLAAVSKVDFAAPPPAVPVGTSRVSEAVARIFDGTLVIPGRPNPTSLPPDWSEYGISYFAAKLPDIVSALSSAGSGPRTLTAHLSVLRDRCLLLGVIELCINARLTTLTATPGIAGPISKLEEWFKGFREYGTIAAFALAQPSAVAQGRPLEGNVAEAVIRALLAPLNVGVNFPPAGLPEEAKPYLANLGVFWGWGAEKCRPDTPTSPEMIAAILRPECAYAGENGATMAALGTLSELQQSLQIARSKTAVRDAIQRAGGIASLLRSSLQNA
jgi:hypothetical protein